MKNYFKNNNLFTIITQILIILLPFYVFLSVFFTNIVWIPSFWFFIKEFLLVILFFSLCFLFYKNKKLPQLDILDYLVFFYIFYWIIITFINWLWINSIIHWWRYDFMFLIVMLIYKHWTQFLTIKLRDLLKLFVYSWAMALLFWVMLKFRLKEEFLMEFGYVDYSGHWTFTWWIPVYHWLENSWMRRFQWIFDWPNAMAYFLILFSGVYLYLQRKKNEYYVILSMIILFWFLLMTFSRSAILGVLWAIGLIWVLNLNILFKKYKKTFLSLVIWWLVFLWSLGVIFSDQLVNIVIRPSSTTGHFDRMIMWIERFTEKPLWAGLAESWPWYRYIYPDKLTKEDELKYIPESWYIQVLIEWWIIYLITFLAILWIVLRRLYNNSIIIFWVLIAIMIMNLFLHIFEVTYISILAFLFIWLFISVKKLD